MRTISEAMLPAAVRTVESRAVVKNRLPVFAQSKDRPLMIYAHDVVVRASKIYRAASAASDVGIAPTLHTQEIEYPNTTHPGFINTGVVLMKGSGISVSNNYIFMHKADGAIVRRSISDSSLVTLTTSAVPVGLAAVSDSEVYIFYKVSNTTYGIALRDLSGLVSTWHGSVYGERFYPGAFDADRIGNTDYIIYATADKKNARMIRRYGEAWSDAEAVFPIDVVDDTSQFRLGGVSVLNDQLVITGILSRPDYRMKIYTIGPDHFTLGRELFIAEGEHVDHVLGDSTVIGSPGKMITMSDWLYVFGGDGSYHSAKSTFLFGADRTDQKVEIGIVDVQNNTQANRPARITMKVPVEDNCDLLTAGNIIDWYVTVNNVEAKLGTFSIDVVLDSREGNGETISLIARSLGCKYLSAWNSDSSFDYWSQTKQSSDVSEMNEVIRGTGLWEERGDFITMQDFNEKGILYTVERSTRNGVAIGEFRLDFASGFSGKYGVAVAYHRETPQDAAARLGVDIAGDNDCVNHGFFFVVDSYDGSTTLYSVFNNEWTVLDTGPLFTPGTVSHWLRVEFHEGEISCSVRTDTTWSTVITHNFVSDTGNPSPWFQEEVGKAAIYVENVSINSASYGFGTQDALIPVEDNSLFASADIVQIDNEKIRYDGKSSEITPIGPLSWVDGATFKGAPHGNTYDFPEMLIAGAEAPTAYANTYQDGLIAGSFVSSDRWELKRIELYVSKVGSPVNLSIAVATDAFDNYGGVLPAAAVKATGTLSAPFSSAQWVSVTLSSTVVLQPDQAYFIVIYNTGQTAANHYRLWHQSSSGIRRQLYRTWSPWETDDDLALSFRAYAHGSVLPGYEIYFDGKGEAIDPKAYNDCALVFTDGPGAGTAYRITGYDYTAPQQWVPVNTISGWENFVGESQQGEWVDQDYRRVFVDKNPSSVFTEDTRAMIVPALVISQRGIKLNDEGVETVEDYGAVAHANSVCSIFRNAFVGVRSFQYFSGEKDWTLEEMLGEIFGKANVIDFTSEKRLYTSGIGNGSQLDTTSALADAIEGESAIVKFQVNSWSSGGIGLAVFPPDEGEFSDVEMAAVVVRQNQIDLYRGAAPALVESYPLQQAIEGQFTISFQRVSFSVWNNGKFLCHFDWPESRAEDSTLNAGFKIGVLTSGPVSYFVDWPMLDQRVDNYILDIGQSGLSLATSLIGEKRVYFLDDMDGNPHLFRSFTLVNEDDPLDLAVSSSVTKSDIELRTRLRVEGAEVAEMIDYDAIALHGNRFALIGLREANNILEAHREGTLIQEDLLRTYTQIPLTGAMDCRLEPGDLVEIYFDDGKRTVLIDSMNTTMVLTKDTAIFDMNIDGAEYDE
jgi:hypothetical protein